MGSWTVSILSFLPTGNLICFSYEEIQGKLSPFLKTLGFNPKNDITYIPCSGLQGSFLKERPAAGSGDWYT
jgi:peptide chain release factor subunit 3